MINQVMKKISHSFLILLIAFLPCLAIAQTTDTSTTTDTTDTSASTTTIVDTSIDTTIATTTSPQQATTSQTTIDSSDVQNADNPQTGSSTNSTISTDASSTPTDASSGDDQEIIVDTPTTTPATEIVPTPDTVVQDVAPQTDDVATLPNAVLTPTKEYTFALSGQSIATQQTPDWNQDATNTPSTPDKTVTASPALNANDTNGLTVSGACSDPYFVILLYKNQSDYNNNPSSYIFNKAYPCENESYSYQISQLPFNLESGTFYLLVAGQGVKGSWKPITALIPVGITVTTVYPTATTTDDSSTTTNTNE
jgi:hypothetical protein